MRKNGLTDGACPFLYACPIRRRRPLRKSVANHSAKYVKHCKGEAIAQKTLSIFTLAMSRRLINCVDMVIALPLRSNCRMPY